MDSPENIFLESSSKLKKEDKLHKLECDENSVAVHNLIDEFISSKSCALDPLLVWDPPTIMRNLSYLPNENSLERLQKLLHKTSSYVKQLQSSRVEVPLNAIIARGRCLRAFPRFIENIHECFAANTKIYADTAACESKSCTSVYSGQKSSLVTLRREESFIENSNKEWSKRELTLKLQQLEAATYMEAYMLSIEAIDQISSIWLKQHKQIALYKKEQFRICNLALLHLLQMSVLERMTTIVMSNTPAGTQTVFSLSSGRNKPETRFQEFEYSLCGIESASEQESCSSSSEGLANVPESLEINAWSKNEIPQYHWNQSTILRLFVEVPKEWNFKRLEKVLRMTDAYEVSLSKRIPKVELLLIKQQAEKLNTFLDIAKNIHLRLFPEALEHMSLEVFVNDEASTEHSFISGVRSLFSTFSSKKASKNLLSQEKSFIWTLEEIEHKKMEIAKASTAQLFPVVALIQQQICAVWAEQYKAIRLLEKQQYRITNLALLKSLKIAVMEQIKAAVALNGHLKIY